MKTTAILISLALVAPLAACSESPADVSDATYDALSQNSIQSAREAHALFDACLVEAQETRRKGPRCTAYFAAAQVALEATQTALAYSAREYGPGGETMSGDQIATEMRSLSMNMKTRAQVKQLGEAIGGR